MHLSVYHPFNLTPVYSSLAWTICNLRHTKTHFCRSFSRLACWLTLIELFLRKNAAIESTGDISLQILSNGHGKWLGALVEFKKILQMKKKIEIDATILLRFTNSAIKGNAIFG